jgi:hypothetical protein
LVGGRGTHRYQFAAPQKWTTGACEIGFEPYRILSDLLVAIRMNNEHIPVRRHRLTGLDVCDVTTDELDAIERQASDVGLDFQIAVFCLTLSLSFFATLLTVKIESMKVFTVFVVIVTAGLLIGSAFGIKWYKNRGSLRKLIQKIRDRQIGPVGEEGKELKPSSLGDIESMQPTIPTVEGPR